MEVKRIVIGIQARSTSTRFPKKVFEMIGNKTILQHVVDSCRSCCSYINKHTGKSQIYAKIALLIPAGDIIKSQSRGICPIFEGPPIDVLTRYVDYGATSDADYVVRVTADCPMIPPFTITKAINTAVQNQYDYTSNVDERLRTSPDGHDVEVISRKALLWLDENAKDQQDREHVTLLLRKRPPAWLTVGHIINHYDQSSIKLSVDTPEDLERVRAHHQKLKTAIETGEALSGSGSVHRF